jgi:hypothetical protein
VTPILSYVRLEFCKPSHQIAMLFRQNWQILPATWVTPHKNRRTNGGRYACPSTLARGRNRSRHGCIEDPGVGLCQLGRRAAIHILTLPATRKTLRAQASRKQKVRHPHMLIAAEFLILGTTLSAEA